MTLFTTSIRTTSLGLLTCTGSFASAEPANFDLADRAGELFTSGFFLTLGFSFMVGMAMGFALKVAFKIALLVMGLMLLGVFGLQYAGFVEINWIGIEGHYDGWAAWLSAAGGAFLSFVGNNLSSGASFLAGLALGLKF